jgi:hypothetical protein
LTFGQQYQIGEIIKNEVKRYKKKNGDDKEKNEYERKLNIIEKSIALDE